MKHEQASRKISGLETCVCGEMFPTERQFTEHVERLNKGKEKDHRHRGVVLESTRSHEASKSLGLRTRRTSITTCAECPAVLLTIIPGQAARWYRHMVTSISGDVSLMAVKECNGN